MTDKPPLLATPRITLFDLDSDVKDALADRGYAAREGSFGERFYVVESNSFYPLTEFGGDIPEHVSEDEIIVVDLSSKPPSATIPRPTTAKTVKYWWQNMQNGVINPRPLAMANVRGDVARLVDNGGVLLAFVGPRYAVPYRLGHHLGGSDVYGDDHETNTWNVLAILASDKIASASDEGNVILPNKSIPLGAFLARYLNDATFTATIYNKWGLTNFAELAKNKFGACVAASFEVEDGLVVLLPDLADKAAFVADFIADYLPDVKPALFPESGSARWIHESPYEAPEVIDLEGRILEIAAKAAEETAKLQASIATYREDHRLEYELLTQTGTPLVNAVKHALETLGFKDVVHVDNEADAKGDKKPLAEDLQVRDSSPKLIIEVKGIGGMPTDDDLLAAHKYLAPRMKEWKDTDLKAVCIINQQKHIPALDRDHDVIRAELGPTVAEYELGVMTTWDLSRLVRSAKALGWTIDQVRPIFASTGRLESIPAHYEFIGIATNYIEGISVCGVTIVEGELVDGDRVAFETPTVFVEQIASGLQVDNKPVPKAGPVNTVGFKTGYPKAVVEGTKVYRVHS